MEDAFLVRVSKRATNGNEEFECSADRQALLFLEQTCQADAGQIVHDQVRLPLRRYAVLEYIDDVWVRQVADCFRFLLESLQTGRMRSQMRVQNFYRYVAF